MAFQTNGFEMQNSRIGFSKTLIKKVLYPFTTRVVIEHLNQINNKSSGLVFNYLEFLKTFRFNFSKILVNLSLIIYKFDSKRNFFFFRLSNLQPFSCLGPCFITQLSLGGSGFELATFHTKFIRILACQTARPSSKRHFAK